MFTIRDEHGIFTGWKHQSYELACAVASELRSYGRLDWFVVDMDTGRAVSEVISEKVWQNLAPAASRIADKIFKKWSMPFNGDQWGEKLV